MHCRRGLGVDLEERGCQRLLNLPLNQRGHSGGEDVGEMIGDGRTEQQFLHLGGQALFGMLLAH